MAEGTGFSWERAGGITAGPVETLANIDSTDSLAGFELVRKQARGRPKHARRRRLATNTMT